MLFYNIGNCAESCAKKQRAKRDCAFQNEKLFYDIFYMHHSILIQNYGDSIRACPVIQQGHCLAVPQSAGECTPADCGYETPPSFEAGDILPTVIFIKINALIRIAPLKKENEI